MTYLKKYGKRLIFTITSIIISLFLLTILYYFNIIGPNLNKVFRDAMNKEKNCFALKNDVATNYGDMHHSYRELFPKSFWN